MTAKKFIFDPEGLWTIFRRHIGLLCGAAIISLVAAGLITSRLIRSYEAYVVMGVEQNSVTDEIVKDRAIGADFNEQLATLRYRVLNNDFLEASLVTELNLQKEDIYVPPGGLFLVEKLLSAAKSVENTGKRIIGIEVYAAPDSAQEKDVVAILKRNIRLQQMKGRMIKVSFSSPNAERSKEIVMIIAEKCKSLLLRDKRQETHEALRYITQQYEENTGRLRKLESELARLRVEMFDKTPEAKIALLQQLEKTQDLLDETRQGFASFTMKRHELLQAKEERQTELRQDPGIIAQLAVITQNQSAIELKTLKNRLENLRRTYTDEHYEIKSLTEEIARLEAQMEIDIKDDPGQEEKIFLADTLYNEYSRQLTRIESEITTLSTQENKFLARIEKYEQKLREMPQVEKSFDEIQRQIQLYEKLQLDFAEKLEAAKATKELENLLIEDKIKIVGEQFSSTPSGPPSIAIAGFLSLTGPGVCIVLLLLGYAWKNPIKNTEDVQQEYNLPVLASIPEFRNSHSEITHAIGLMVTFILEQTKARTKIATPVRTEALSSPVFRQKRPVTPPENGTAIQLSELPVERFPISKWILSDNPFPVMLFRAPNSDSAEAYRTLCFNVTWEFVGARTSSPFRGEGQPFDIAQDRDARAPKFTIMVTSAARNEGKTNSAINLAAMLARSHKVLLLDANFRAPSLAKAFDLSQTSGFVDLLEQDTLPLLYYPESLPKLHILPAGFPGLNPADLLTEIRVEQLIKRLKTTLPFDYIIFDAPPTEASPETAVLASNVDGIIWSIREMKTTKENVHHALKSLKNPNILGVVLHLNKGG